MFKIATLQENVLTQSNSSSVLCTAINTVLEALCLFCLLKLTFHPEALTFARRLCVGGLDSVWPNLLQKEDPCILK